MTSCVNSEQYSLTTFPTIFKNFQYQSLGPDEYVWAAGKRIFLYRPKPSDYQVHDVARGLSRIGRFNGHTHYFYSVARHSINVCRNAPKHLQLHALGHDGSEFCLQDFLRSWKYLPGIRAIYCPIEELHMKALATWWGFEYNAETKQQIKDIERPVELAEIRDLVDVPTEDEIDFSGAIQEDLYREYTFKQDEEDFLDMYYKIVDDKFPY